MKYLYTLILLLSFSISVNAQIYVHATVPGATEVRIQGPWWGDWSLTGGPLAEDNGDGTWTFTFDPAPTENMEFKLVKDGVAEDYSANYGTGVCDANTSNLNTDGSNYFNRLFNVGDGPNMYITFSDCSVLTLQTPDNLIKSVHLYPNPTSDFVRISAGESIDLVQVFDVTGRVVKESSPEKSDFSLNVSNLSKGVYLVKLNSGDKEATTKLIK